MGLFGELQTGIMLCMHFISSFDAPLAVSCFGVGSMVGVILVINK